MFYKRVIVALAALLMLVACDVDLQEIGDTPVLDPIPTDRSEYSIPAPDGTYPCGLAEVDWGFHAFRLEDVPACREHLPDVTVYCLNGEGSWNAVNITSVSIDVASNLVMFDIEQTGLCGIFPAADQ